jgi:uncharacterized lipoprotein YddW (UPF0748 family)
MKKWFLLLILCFAFASPALPQQTRCLWVTRWEYHSPQDIEKIVDTAANMNIHVILFQVRGAAAVAYPSSLEPMDSLFVQQPPWDPLQTAIDAAHQRGIQLHAWVNVYPASMGTETPGGNDPAAQHPDWVAQDVYGDPQVANSHYTWFSPTHPEVIEHLFQVFREIYSRYDIDGIHFDYIRFPGLNYSYDPPSLDLFRRIYKAEPEQRPQDWSNWRRHAVTTLLTLVRNDLKTVKPNLVVSAAVVSDANRARDVYLQDGFAWLAADLVDVLYPMIYTPDNNIFKRELTNHLQNSHGRHIYAGINLKSGDPANQLRIAAESNAPGVAFFSYSELDHGPDSSITVTLKKTKGDSLPAAMPWKDYLRDSQGPLISQIRSIPSPLIPGKPFKIAAKIIDPSGVYEGKSAQQGVHVNFGNQWPPADSTLVSMKRIPQSNDWYISADDLPPQTPGSTVFVQVAAYDDFHESAKNPRRNQGVSDVTPLPVISPDSTYVPKGAIGPLLWNPVKPAVDINSNVWVTCAKQGIVVFNRDGRQVAFSPIAEGLAREYDYQRLDSVVGFACGAFGTMLIACNTQPAMIFRFDCETGDALPGIELSYSTGGIATDHDGHIFVLEKNSSAFHVLSPTGIELGSRTFGGGSSATSIAVLQNGGMVFITDRSENCVQQWYGAVEGEYAQYWHAKNITTVDVGLGQVAVGERDLLYICETPRNLISVYDRVGTFKGQILKDVPLMIEPLAATFSPSFDRLYVLSQVGVGPTQIHYWEK